MSDRERDLEDELQRKERRRIHASRREERSWFGLGMLGLVGWSFAIPMLAVLAIGIWIDSRHVSPYSWSLMAVFVGVGVGALNAWHWVKHESTRIEEDEQNES